MIKILRGQPTSYTYDDLDRVKTKAAPQGTLSYAYDAAGNLLTLQSSNTNGASASYAYDALNRLQTVTDNRLAAGQQQTAYTYDAVDNVTSVAYPNGVNHSLTLDQMNRLMSLSIAKGSVLASYSYTYGPAGNKTGASEATGRSTAFNYDSVYRLVQETISTDPSAKSGSLNYSLDPVGNRRSLTSSLSGISSTTESYDADDRLTTDTYDADGNTLTSGSYAYGYDFLNRLINVDSGAVTMAYDGEGNRVAKDSTQYLVSEVNPTGLPQVMDEILGGAVQRTYAYGLMRISETQLVSGTWTPSFYSYDGHNDVRLLTSPAGVVTDTYEYDSYGNLVALTGSTSNVFFYQGEQFDQETGFYYLRARYYNLATGRFLNTDTITDNHPYGYAGADPVNKNDPTGKDLAFISIESQLLTGLAAQLTPSASLHNNFGGGVFTPADN